MQRNVAAAKRQQKFQRGGKDAHQAWQAAVSSMLRIRCCSGPLDPAKPFPTGMVAVPLSGLNPHGLR